MFIETSAKAGFNIKVGRHFCRQHRAPSSAQASRGSVAVCVEGVCSVCWGLMQCCWCGAVGVQHVVLSSMERIVGCTLAHVFQCWSAGPVQEDCCCLAWNGILVHTETGRPGWCQSYFKCSPRQKRGPDRSCSRLPMLTIFLWSLHGVHRAACNMVSCLQVCCLVTK